jgi:hypothetical protein
MEQQQRQHNELIQAASETPGPAAVVNIPTQNNVADGGEPMDGIA